MKPSSVPASAPRSATKASSTKVTVSTKRWLAPMHFRSATTSRWRVAKRRAPIATATAASSTVTSAARFRKRAERSIADFICSLDSPTSTSRSASLLTPRSHAS